MHGLPSFEIRDSHAVTPIATTLLCDIDSDAGSDHTVEWNLVHRLLPIGKFNRRIDVGAAVLRHLYTV